MIPRKRTWKEDNLAETMKGTIFMPKGNLVTLTQMQSGQSGVVAEIQGGFGLIDRLNALGIMPGKRITKISAMIARGPVTIEVDRVQVAIGFGMAKKIIVESGRVR
jgi:ferrous iron transport protein A